MQEYLNFVSLISRSYSHVDICYSSSTDNWRQDSLRWECILLLLEITKYCTARVTSASASYVKALVDHHHKGFTQCYPDKKHTPKLHYMVHFPTQLLAVSALWIITTYNLMHNNYYSTGPLITTWCVRMEAKHCYFKSVAHLGIYRNVPYSVSRRQQIFLKTSRTLI